jgi:hypothetical protein
VITKVDEVPVLIKVAPNEICATLESPAWWKYLKVNPLITAAALT